jgi:ABC-type multidrug transport system fused ATPase/permease subunit
LLQRFYDPDHGRLVVVNGDETESDLRNIPLTVHRRRMAVVSQDPVLFHGSLYDNLVYGQPQKQEPSDDDDDEALEQQQRRVREALRLAHADEFVSAFPDGVATQVGERAIQLSGGEKQRIAIARAILNDCHCLILDEATSALDGHSENAIQAALDEWMMISPNRIILIIAHRLRTIRNADQIIVLQEGGVIAENGTHEELWRLDGLYRKMVEDSSNNNNNDQHNDFILE